MSVDVIPGIDRRLSMLPAPNTYPSEAFIWRDVLESVGPGKQTSDELPELPKYFPLSHKTDSNKGQTEVGWESWRCFGKKQSV